MFVVCGLFLARKTGEKGEILYHQFCRGNIVPTQEHRDKFPDLLALLERTAINNEILVAVSDYNLILQGMLTTFIECVQRAGVKNYLIVALDDKLGEHLQKINVPYYRRDAVASEKQKNLGANHRISGLKFQILKDFLLLGYNVLLSDVDIVTLNNPFDHLYRDADVESLSDGFNDHTVYGYDDVFDDPDMGWARYAHTFRIFVYNSGLFYMRATYTSVNLVDRVVGWLEAESAWDQAVFNLVIWKPSHDDYIGLNPTTRAMNYAKFVNSKYFFKYVRHDRNLLARAAKEICMLHVNYHPQKYERMLAIVDYFVHGKKDAISVDKHPDGSETPERLRQIREEEEKRRRGNGRRLLAHMSNSTAAEWIPDAADEPASPFYH